MIERYYIKPAADSVDAKLTGETTTILLPINENNPDILISIHDVERLLFEAGYTLQFERTIPCLTLQEF